MTKPKCQIDNCRCGNAPSVKFGHVAEMEFYRTEGKKPARVQIFLICDVCEKRNGNNYGMVTAIDYEYMMNFNDILKSYKKLINDWNNYVKEEMPNSGGSEN